MIPGPKAEKRTGDMGVKVYVTSCTAIVAWAQSLGGLVIMAQCDERLERRKGKRKGNTGNKTNRGEAKQL